MNKKKVILGSGILVILIVTMALIWTNFREKPVEGSKTITIEVVNSEEESKVYELNTDAEYLQQVMEEAKKEGLTFEVDETKMLIVVNGEKAVYTENEAYWALYVNEAYGQHGIEEQPVEDGDVFEIVYTEAQ